MKSQKYVPDVSVFFEGERKFTVEDLLRIPCIEQESVSFEKNDIYMGNVQSSYKCNRKIKRKCRKKGKIRRT